MVNEIDLGITADMHVHLRDGKMMELVTPAVRDGGISIAYIMPNLVPPITTIERVVEYKKRLEALAPQVTFLMTFYLSKELTPELIEEAARIKAIKGVKCYPAGVTTNSQEGVDPNDFTPFYPIFKVMEKNNLVLNLHGEKPPSKDDNIDVLNAESKFLPALKKLHQDFPTLKIVLEHCTTKAAIDTIEELNSDYKEGNSITVAGTITAHHLSLTVDNWAGSSINFCKPVPKLPQDRKALVEAATSAKPYFFFGSDSAPHPLSAKTKHLGASAGVYTQSRVLSYLAEVFENQDKLANLKKFVSVFGRNFYCITDQDIICHDSCILVRRTNTIPEVIGNSELEVAPFKAGEVVSWAVEWKSS